MWAVVIGLEIMSIYGTGNNARPVVCVQQMVAAIITSFLLRFQRRKLKSGG